MSTAAESESATGRLGGSPAEGADPSPGVAAGAAEEDWKDKYPDLASVGPPEQGPPRGTSIVPSNISVEDAVAVVKEKMWYIGDAALKSVAEVLYGFGISPTVLGYSEEELMEEDELYGGMYPPPQQKDEVVSKSSFSMRSEDRLQRRKADDPSGQPVDEAEDGGVQFLAPEDGGWRVEEEVIEFGEDKKDK